MSVTTLFIGLAVCIACFPIDSRADSIIFDNFASGSEKYLANTGVGIDGRDSFFGNGHTQQAAFGFSPSGSFDLTQITVAMSWIGGSNGVVLSLDTSNSALLPGTSLTSWRFFNLPRFGSTSSTLETMTFAPGIVLQKGQLYWIVASPYGTNTEDGWNLNAIGFVGEPYALNIGQGWYFVGNVQGGAFEVLGKDVVPEPSTLFLLGTGLIGILVRRRRQIKNPKLCFRR